MTSAQAQKRPLSEAAQVPSHFACGASGQKSAQAKSLVTCVNTSEVPLSKRERREGNGCYSPTHSLLSQLSPKTIPSLASYHGAISRWCALTGNTPDATGHADKLAAELKAFEDHLANLSAEKQHMESLQF